MQSPRKRSALEVYRDLMETLPEAPPIVGHYATAPAYSIGALLHAAGFQNPQEVALALAISVPQVERIAGLPFGKSVTYPPDIAIVTRLKEVATKRVAAYAAIDRAASVMLDRGNAKETLERIRKVTRK